MAHTEKSILKILNRDFLSQPKYLINNLYVFSWESDYLALTKSGYWYEIEVKISRSDFKADFKKDRKHKTLMRDNDRKCPNYFYYAVPENLISVDEIPEYAGLIYIDDHGYSKTIKGAPLLHKDKLKLDLQDKFYYNWKEEKRKISQLEKELQRYKNPAQAKINFNSF